MGRPPQTHKTPTGFSWPSAGNEELVYPLVRSGALTIDRFGRVWRVGRFVRTGKPGAYGRSFVRYPEPVRADKCDTGNGTPLVRHKIGGSPVAAVAARLVWMHLRGPIAGKSRVTHIDGDWSNNHPDNLNLVPCSEIIRTIYRRDPERSLLGCRNAAAKMTAGQVVEARRRVIVSGETCAAIAREYGVTTRCISLAVSGHTWRHVGA